MNSLEKLLKEVYENDKKARHKSVVRLKNSSYMRGGSLITEVKLTPMKKLSEGYHLLTDNVGDVGVEEVSQQIINLYGQDDGLYDMVSIQVDEDEWDIRLEKYKE